MERKLEIPKMSDEDIAKRYETIKPIVSKNGKAVWLRKLSSGELSYKVYMSLDKEGDYAGDVNFSNLSPLADVKILHRYGYYGFFKPSVGEVLAQIPNEMLHKVTAFEMIYSPSTCADFNVFNKEFHSGYHVSIVRLYQPKDDTNEAAEQIERYPTKESVTPVGMTEEEFQKLKALFGQED